MIRSTLTGARGWRFFPPLLLAVFLGLSSGAHALVTKVLLIGDSTVAHYEDPAPMRGWGQFLQPYFRERVQVIDGAVGGKSSKSYDTAGVWNKMVGEKPDFLIIQFGQNDSLAPDQPGSTRPEGEYRTYLIKYVDAARKMGAFPIIVTPIQNRSFDATGQLMPTLAEYAESARKVAREKDVPLIDLYARSFVLFNHLGKEKCEELAASPGDFIHLNEAGARALANIVARELRQNVPLLAAKMLSLQAVLAGRREAP